MASNFYKKQFKHSAAVREILTALGAMFHPNADRNAIIQSVFGPSAALSKLQREGKLEPSKEAREWSLPPQASGKDQSGKHTINETIDALPTIYDAKPSVAVGAAVTTVTTTDCKKRKLSSMQVVDERSEAEDSRG
jgi:hypothetical protein